MQKEIDIAVMAAKKAGNLVLSLQGSISIQEKESNFNIVTSADTAAQRCIADCILQNFPEDTIYGEEDNSRPPLDSQRLWVIDPIDGTTNFAHNIPHFAISIAFLDRGVIRCGVVYNPVNGELYSAELGQGAWCNGKSISVSPTDTLPRSVIATGFFYERGPLMVKTLDTIRQLLVANIQGIRRMGSAALDLCYVACGRYDGYFEYRLSPWDFAAGVLIVHEAGGKCVDFDGTEKGIFAQGMICSNRRLHQQFLDIVRLDALPS